jgi:TRAP-type uncharacterized transport system substrate-binding protein
MQANAQVTGGSVDNVKLVHAGDAEIGFATLDSAYDGLQGQGAYARRASRTSGFWPCSTTASCTSARASPRALPPSRT